MKRYRFALLMSVLSLFGYFVAGAQDTTLQKRVSALELRVNELRTLHGLPPILWTSPATYFMPLELEGNENVEYGYPGGRGIILAKEHYVISHNNRLRIPEWAAYHLTRDYLNGNANRTNDFRPDPALPPGDRSEIVDYRNSGYDRGHMAPAADFKRSETGMSETFLLSNMCPQRPNLNRAIWEKLEEQVRSLARVHGNIWVLTGALFLDDSSKPCQPTAFIGPDSVAVPTHFFKVILCVHGSGKKEMYAFVLKNQLSPISGQPRDYMVTVARVEQMSGLDFFNALPLEEQDRLESTVETNWPIEE